ncbi:MAG: ATP-binding cassette domain-containing protein [Candidatus Anstonellales archaeon]
MSLLEVRGLSVSSGGNEIISDVSIEVRKGEIVALIGPNGSGKSTLCNAIAGKPYDVIGSIYFEGRDILKDGADKRARMGILLVHQSMPMLEGIKLRTLLSWLSEVHGEGIIEKAEKNAAKVGFGKEEFEKDIAKLSGGERKRMEMLLMVSLPSKLVIIDELDSGLDIDGLRVASEIIENMKKEEKGILIVSHYPFILERLQPDRVYLMESGRIKKSGGMEIVKGIKEKGYLRDENGC